MKETFKIHQWNIGFLTTQNYIEREWTKEKLEILKTHQWHNWVYCNNFEITLKGSGQNKILKKNLKIRWWNDWKYCNNLKIRMDKNEYGKNPSRFTNETIGFIVTIQNHT